MLSCSAAQYGLLGLEPDVSAAPDNSLSHTTTFDQLLTKSIAAIHARREETVSQDTAAVLEEAYAALLRLQQALPPS